MVDLSIELPEGFLDEEEKTLVVPRWRKEVWAISLDLLVQLDRVCRKHGIRYFCDGGTALGAVRHRGFVPWDDDLDVVMSRAEYAKLDAIASTEFKHPYFWQTNATDPGSARGHAQLRNSNTTGILKSEMHDGRPIYTFNQGLFIDIFPFDNLPDDADERRIFRNNLKKLKARISQIRLIQHYRRVGYSGCSFLRKLYWRYKAARLRIDGLVHGCDELGKAASDLESLAQKYNGVPAKEMAPVSFKPDHREVLPSSFFDKSVNVDFEFMKIPVMEQHLKALEINYGNWREHVIGCAAHGGMFIDTNRPYTAYVR